MEPEGSSLCSQEPTTGPYPESDESNSHRTILFFCNIYSNIILSCMPASSEWSLTFRFPNQNIVCISHLFHTHYMSRTSHPPWFDHPNNIWWSVQVMKLLIMQSFPASSRFPLLRLSAPLNTIFSDTLVFIFPQQIRIIYILIISFHENVGLPNYLFPCGFQTKIVCTYLFLVCSNRLVHLTLVLIIEHCQN
jgi:hypothetical protein